MQLREFEYILPPYSPLTLADFTPNQAFSGLADRPFDLVDLRDRSPGSKLHEYRRRIIKQLERDQTFFFNWLLEYERTRGSPGLNQIVHLSIEVTEKVMQGAMVGVNVENLCFRPFVSRPESGLSHIVALSRWKEERVRDSASEVAIGFAFDFRVYCPEIVVDFWVLMGFKMERELFKRLLRKSTSNKWWREKVFVALSDPPKRCHYTPRKEVVLPPVALIGESWCLVD